MIQVDYLQKVESGVSNTSSKGNQNKWYTDGKCPIFDNDAALFSDIKGDYPLNLEVEECINIVRAKPFSMSFDEQLDACELLFPQFPVNMGFTEKDAEDVVEGFRGIYEDAIIERVKETLRIQIRKYAYLFG